MSIRGQDRSSFGSDVLALSQYLFPSKNEFLFSFLPFRLSKKKRNDFFLNFRLALFMNDLGFKTLLFDT